MSDGTKIEWTDATVNAVNGCSVISPGCKLCYAMKQAHRFEARRGLTMKTSGGMVWTGEVRLNEKALVQPLGWKRARRIFWNAHGDLFHENVPDAWIDMVFAVCALTPHHQHQILTKRPERMRKYITGWPDGAARFHHVAAAARDLAPEQMGTPGPDAWVWKLKDRWPLPNVWLGTSIEDRARYHLRAGVLKDTPAAVRFWSAEPLLGDLGDLDPAVLPDWVIVGGESGHGARPLHPGWVLSLRDQCAAAEVPFFFKQWGEWMPFLSAGDTGTFINETGEYTGEKLHRFPDGMESARVGKKNAGRKLRGVTYSEFPA